MEKHAMSPNGSLATLRHGIHDMIGIPADELSLNPHSTGDGLVLGLHSQLALGSVDLRHINSSVVAALSDFMSDGRELATRVDHEVLKLNFQIAGGGSFRFPGGCGFAAQEMTACVSYQPAGMVKRESYRPGDRQAAVTLMCDVAFLQELLDDAITSLPTPLRELLQGRSSDHFSLALPISPEMANAAHALLARDHDARLRRLEVQARSFELIYQLFRRLQYLENQNGGTCLTRAQCERLEWARSHIDRHYARPPTVTQLAHLVGTNETKLTSGFRARFGCTIIGYLHKVRMERARFLLRDTAMPITQIALDVGYEHSANFSTAFKRTYGTTPRAFREQ
jgi:AraC-like DNA-binding protein